MIRLFNSYNNLALLVLAFYVLALRLSILFAAEIPPFHQQGPLGDFLLRLLEAVPIQERWIHFILSSVLIYVQAILVVSLTMAHKVFKRNTYLPALFYVLACSFFPETIYLSAPFIATTLLLVFVRQLFNFFREKKIYGLAFNAGILIGFAALLYFPYLLMLLFGFMALASLRSFNWREFVMLTLGCAFVGYGLGVWYFWFEKLPLLFSSFFDSGGGSMDPSLGMGYLFYLALGVFVLVLVFAFFDLQKMLNKSVIQIRLFIRLFLLMFPLSALMIWPSTGMGIAHFFLLALPISILLSKLLKDLRSPAFAEIIHVTLLLLAVAMQVAPIIQLD